IHATLEHLRSRNPIALRGGKVRIRSGLPPDRGLGSPPAVAAGIAEAAAGAYELSLGGRARFDSAPEAERHAHGSPSGLDARTVLASGPIQFHEGRIRPLAIGADLSFVLADSGVPGSTATAVAGVRALHDTDLGTVDRIIASLADLAAEGEHAL